jgi:uncharacterized membrane protein
VTPAGAPPRAPVGVRLLDAAAAVAAALLLAVLLAGRVPLGPLALDRPEDVLVALTLLVAVRLLLAPRPAPRVRPRAAVAGGVVAYVAVMGFIVVTRHRALATHALDLGQYLQIIWNLAGGRGPLCTLTPTYMKHELMNAWADHLSPVFYLLAPTQWAAPGAVSLLLAQTAILAAGAPALFVYAARRLGDRRAAAGFAGLYLLNPSLHGINIRDIHPAAFAIPLLLAAAAAFDARRYGWCAAALVTTLACREDAAVAVVGFAVWLALARGRWLAGALLALAATLLLGADIAWVMPYFRGAPYNHLNRYAHLGGSLPEILFSIVFRPGRWLGIAFAPPKLVYLAALLGPLAFLPLLGPRALAAAVPGLAMNLLSLDPKLFNPRAQYQAFILPFLFLAAVDGWDRLRALAAAAGDRRWRRPAVVLTAAFLASIVLTSRTANDLGARSVRLQPWQRTARALMAALPPDAAVSANERLVPHLATRPEVYVFPRGVARAAWILDREDVTPEVPPDVFAVVAHDRGWTLWRRR